MACWKPRAGVDRVGHVADQGLEDAELGVEQDQEADEQGDVEQPAPVLLAEGVGHEGGHVRLGRLLAGQQDHLAHEDDRQVHADHGPAEEDHPHVEPEEAHPALPQGGVLLVVGEGQPDRPDLLALAPQPGEVADPGAHAVALVPVVVHHVPVQPRRQGGEPGQAAEQGGVAALGRQGRGDQPAQPVPPDAEGDDEQVDDQQEDELDGDGGQVGQLQAAGDLARDHGDAHHHQQQQDGQQGHRGRVRGRRDLAVEQRVQPLGGRLGPAAPDEGEEQRDQRERDPQPGPGRYPAEADDGHLAGGQHVARELEVVEDLEQGRDGDDPADADEPEGADVEGPSSHSPLPIEIPSAIRLGPRTNFTTSLRPRWGTPKTSSGSGRSTTGKGSPTPRGWVVVVWSGGGDVALSIATPPAATLQKCSALYGGKRNGAASVTAGDHTSVVTKL